MIEFFEKLKIKWGIENNWQVIAILLAFSFAGSSVVFLRRAYFDVLGFDDLTPFWVKSVAYILFIFPAYQGLLLTYGTLLGQFKFFWEKEKALFKRLTGRKNNL